MNAAEGGTAKLGAGGFSASDQLPGMVLVFLSALVWSFGGTIALFLATDQVWTVVFWRSVWAGIFLLAFMLWRDGPAGTAALFRGMGWPGAAVAACFATASVCFVVALGYTTVANIVLMQAGVPLLAALISLVVYGEEVGRATGAAIVAVIAGIAVMVSDGLGGGGSALGSGLALLIALAFALATVITRRFAHVRMTPANCVGVVIAAAVAAVNASGFAVSPGDMGTLVVFGAVNLGLGLALFASGARLLPAALAALIGVAEPVLGPVWVWLVHGQVPAMRTLVGGGIVFVALLVHLFFELRRQKGPAKPGAGGLPLPS